LTTVYNLILFPKHCKLPWSRLENGSTAIESSSMGTSLCFFDVYCLDCEGNVVIVSRFLLMCDARLVCMMLAVPSRSLTAWAYQIEPSSHPLTPTRRFFLICQPQDEDLHPK